MAIVQFANTLEWAYLARRDGLIEQEVWNSWISTWKNVIAANASDEHLLDHSVWTFGRTGKISEDLKLITRDGIDLDPFVPLLDRVATLILREKK